MYVQERLISFFRLMLLITRSWLHWSFFSSLFKPKEQLFPYLSKSYQTPFLNHRFISTILVSIVVSIPACHAGDQGSIP